MTGNAKRIFLIDDHPGFSMGITCLLNGHGFQVMGQVATTAEAKISLKRERCDLLITDVSLKNAIALDAIPEFRTLFPDMAVLVLSMHDDPKIAAQAFNAGAIAYATKGDPPEIVLEAVQKALRGEHFITPTLRNDMLRGFSEARKASPTDDLSPRERQVLRLLGQGQSRSEMAANLGLSSKTIDSFFSILKKKLLLSSNKELIKFAVTHGLQEPR